jgi:hypothetical protein
MGLLRFNCLGLKPVVALAAIIFLPFPCLATEPFDFVSAVIRSWERCLIADSRIKSSEKDDFVSLMKDLQVFGDEIQQANSLVKPHTKSENELIRKSAIGFSKLYAAIVTNNEQAIDLLEDALNDPRDFVSKQGTWLRKLSENTARNEQLWRMMLDLTVLSTYALMDENRVEDGKLPFLRITKNERDRLRLALRKTFGEKVTEGIKAGQFPLEGSGGLLWVFLSKPWKVADAR